MIQNMYIYVCRRMKSWKDRSFSAAFVNSINADLNTNTLLNRAQFADQQRLKSTDFVSSQLHRSGLSRSVLVTYRTYWSIPGSYRPDRRYVTDTAHGFRHLAPPVLSI